jgi:sugar phosphate isomerase/epimerase
VDKESPMKIGLCTSVEKAPVAYDAGFDYVEEHVQNFLVPEQPDEDFAPNLEALRNASLPVIAANCFLPGSLKCVGPEVDADRLAQYANTAFRRAHESGIRFIVFGSGAARQVPDGFSGAKARDQVLALLRRIAPLAEAEDVVLLIECLNGKECNFINALAEGASLVEEVGSPHLRLLADIYHMGANGEAPEEIVKQGRWIQHVHVAEQEGREAPGIHGDDFGPFLRALKETDYQGAISFECGWRNFSEQAAGSLRGFREQVRRAGLS